MNRGFGTSFTYQHPPPSRPDRDKNDIPSCSLGQSEVQMTLCAGCLVIEVVR